MDIKSLFKKQAERNEEKKRQQKAPVIIDDDDDDDDFKDCASSTKKVKVKVSSSKNAPKRKRPRQIINDDSDSDDGVPPKKSKSTPKRTAPSSKTTPTSSHTKTTPTSSKTDSKGKSKKSGTTPSRDKNKKNSIQSISAFLGSAPIKRTNRPSNPAAKTEQNIKSEAGGNGSRKSGVDPGDHDITAVPDSPMDNIAEFDDEAIARALQEEEEAQVRREKEKQVHADEEFSRTLDALDESSPSKPPAKKLKIMIERLPVSRSHLTTPTTTPTKRSTTTKNDSDDNFARSKRGSPAFIKTRQSPRLKNKNRPDTSTTSPFKESKAAASVAKNLNKKESVTQQKTPSSIKESPLKVAKKKPPSTSSSSRRAIQYINGDDEDDNTVSSGTGSERTTSSQNVPKKESKSPVQAGRVRQSTNRKPVRQVTASPPPVQHTPGTGSTPKSRSATPIRAGTGSTPKPDSTTPTPTRADSYRKYLNRSGPKAPGSKTIPEGAENCLLGLTFVITGVLESLEREAAAELIKRYGGKVTGNVSGKTSYVVYGDEAGESKMAKAAKFGTKQIVEDDLLELIKTLPTPKSKVAAASKKASTSSKTKKSKSPSPLQSKPVSKPVCTAGPSSFYKSTTTKPASLSQPTAAAVKKPSDNLLWVDRYRPQSTKQLIGQQGNRSNAKKLINWLMNWEKNILGGEGAGKKQTSGWGGRGGAKDNGESYRAALLSGPPGVGKTTTATLVCKEADYTFVEMNASAARNKKTLQNEVAAQVGSLSIDAFLEGSKGGVASGRRHALIMDEVDGMAGNEDRGGVQELLMLIKTTKIPIICICNNRQHTKIRSLANHCFDLRFQKPRVEQIRGAMMSVCFKEGLKIEPLALTEIIMASGNDIRQVLHNLSLWGASDQPLSLDVAKETAKNTKKHSKMNPFDVVRTVFVPRDGDRELTLFEKSDLFFHDYSLSALFVQENYLSAKPHSAGGSVTKTLKCLAKAADSLCDGDLVEKQIRKASRWELLPLQAFLSSVIPGEHMKGYFGKPEFPQWLGMNSKRNKNDRLLQELQSHTRLFTSCDKSEFGMDYMHILTSQLTQPLVSKGSDGIPEVISCMESYDLLREDWDSLVELSHYSGRPQTTADIQTKVKSAFTRAYNKESHLLHYAPTSTAMIKKLAKRQTTADSQDSYGDLENEEQELDSDDDDEDISSDLMIKVIKKDSGVKKLKGEGSKGKGKAGASKGKKKGTNGKKRLT